MKTLLTTPISKSSARQRAGRAGRTGPGTPPGVHTDEVADQILQLKDLGVEEVARFDFIDPPMPEAYLRGIEELKAVSYIDARGSITRTGRRATRFSVDAMWYNAFAEANQLGCLSEMIGIAAIASTHNDLFSRPHAYRYAADPTLRQFGHPMSDLIARLNAMHKYLQVAKAAPTDLDSWCHRSFINGLVAAQVMAIRNQLNQQVQVHICGRGKVSSLSATDPEYDTKIRKALAAGFYHKAALIVADDIYKTYHGHHTASINPDSYLCSVPAHGNYSRLGMAHGLITGDGVVAKDWPEPMPMTDSKDTHNPNPPFRKRTHRDESLLELGVISTALLNERLEERGDEGSHLPEKNEGGPAYIGITLNLHGRGINFYAKDKYNGYINPMKIRFTHYEDEEAAHRACIAHYDRSVLNRVEGYNRTYLIALG
ncbi:hypothetical protein NCS52_00242000 [Fusarium sp. LHS14.1]|nr:hypothetical protein NCS52_00242000 [Fusarium sp. LHS14.1]